MVFKNAFQAYALHVIRAYCVMFVSRSMGVEAVLVVLLVFCISCVGAEGVEWALFGYLGCLAQGGRDCYGLVAGCVSFVTLVVAPSLVDIEASRAFASTVQSHCICFVRL